MLDTRVHPWMIHPHTRKPLEAIFTDKRGRPHWPILGASEDDDADDGAGGDDADEDAEDGVDDADDEDDIDDGKSVDDLKAELARLRNSQAKLLREKRNRGRKDDDTTKNGDGKDTFTKDDVAQLREETREAVRTEMLPAVIRPAARTALEQLGMVFPKDADGARAKLTRALKLADLDNVELDDDGDVVGLAEALREVRRDFPEMFKGTRVRTPGNSGGGRRASTKPKSATEQQAAMVFGGRDEDD